MTVLGQFWDSWLALCAGRRHGDQEQAAEQVVGVLQQHTEPQLLVSVSNATPMETEKAAVTTTMMTTTTTTTTTPTARLSLMMMMMMIIPAPPPPDDLSCVYRFDTLHIAYSCSGDSPSDCGCKAMCVYRFDLPNLVKDGILFTASMGQVPEPPYDPHLPAPRHEQLEVRAAPSCSVLGTTDGGRLDCGARGMHKRMETGAAAELDSADRFVPRRRRATPAGPAFNTSVTLLLPRLQLLQGRVERSRRGVGAEQGGDGGWGPGGGVRIGGHRTGRRPQVGNSALPILLLLLLLLLLYLRLRASSPSTRPLPSPPQPASPASPASLRSASPCLHIPCCLCGRAVHTCVLALCCTHDAWAAPLRGARSAPCLIVLPSPRRAQRADKRAERIAAVPRGCGQVCDDASQRCVRKKPGSESHAVLVRVSTGSWGRASSCSVKKGHRTHDNE